MSEPDKTQQEFLNAPALYARFVRLNAIAQLLVNETSEALNILKDLAVPELPDTLVGGVPVAKSAVGGVDHEAILRRLQQKEAQPEGAAPAAEGGMRFTLYEPSQVSSEVEVAVKGSFTSFFGVEGLLAEFFGLEIIIGGAGTIRPSVMLPQYEEDLNTATPERLFVWPQGFYRNALTKEQQFMFRSEDRQYIFCIDSLPSNHGKVVVYDGRPSSNMKPFERRELPIYRPLTAKDEANDKHYAEIARARLSRIVEILAEELPKAQKQASA